MKAKLYIIVALLATALTAVAQNNNKDQRTRWMNEVRNQKYEFIVKETDMTKDQQDEFLPIYKEMEKAIFTANQEARALELKVTNQTRTTEAEYAAAALMLARVKQREGDIEMEYYQKFERILSKKQLFQLKRAENKFTQYMLSHHRRSANSKQ